MNDKLVSQFEQNSLEIQKIETQIAERVREFRDKLTTLQQTDRELRQKLLVGMEENMLKKFENDYISITYVAPFKKVTLDTTTLKVEEPETYAKYSKTSDVKASIRIKVKAAK